MFAKKYRKKPVVIEAVQLVDSPYVFVDYLTSEKIKEEDVIRSFGQDEAGIYVYINTLEGVMRASEGDYIIRGVRGEFYPCKPDIFEQTYEKVD